MSWVPSVTLVSGLDEAKGSGEGQDFPGTGGRQDAKFQRQRPLGLLSPTCPRASFILPCQAVTEGAGKGFAAGRACTALAFVFPKSLQPRVSQFVRAGMQAALGVFV